MSHWVLSQLEMYVCGSILTPGAVLQSDSNANHLGFCGYHKLKGAVLNKTASRVLRPLSLLIDWLTDYKSRDSHDYLRSNNSLEWLTGFRNVLHLWLQFYFEGYKLGPSKWRNTEGKVWEYSQCSLPRPLPVGFKVCHLPTTFIHQFRSSIKLRVQSFHWVFITGCDWLNHLAMWWNSISLIWAGSKPQPSDQWLVFLVISPQSESSHLLA